MSRQDLLRKIVEPYKIGSNFLCGGNIIDPHDIETIQINTTPEPSGSYLPGIRTRNEASSVFVFGIPDEWYVTQEGKVVTRKFIDAAPGTVLPEISTNKMSGDDERFMRLAIEESKKSKDESDGRVHPKVGAVVVKDGRVLATAYRGEIALGDHAEYAALERKLVSVDLTGAALYTTLEPCTSRAHRTPCSDRIIRRKIAKVVIGVLDPNPSIRGGSIYLLKQTGIEVSFAKGELESEIRIFNKAFLEQQLTAAKATPTAISAPAPVLLPTLTYYRPIAPPRTRALWGYIFGMIAGILVILNAAALLSNSFYSIWVTVFFWLPVIDASRTHALVFTIGVIIGLIVVFGSILMLLGYGTVGGIVVFPVAVLSLLIGGGFATGLVLGVLGGILGMLGK